MLIPVNRIFIKPKIYLLKRTRKKSIQLFRLVYVVKNDHGGHKLDNYHRNNTI